MQFTNPTKICGFFIFRRSIITKEPISVSISISSLTYDVFFSYFSMTPSVVTLSLRNSSLNFCVSVTDFFFTIISSFR